MPNILTGVYLWIHRIHLGSAPGKQQIFTIYYLLDLQWLVKSEAQSPYPDRFQMLRKCAFFILLSLLTQKLEKKFNALKDCKSGAEACEDVITSGAASNCMKNYEKEAREVCYITPFALCI